MYEKQKKHASFLRRSAAAFCAAFLLCAGRGVAVDVTAAGVTDSGESAGRMLIPVGHTVGIKMYARGVMVVDLADGATPARQCGLAKGDVIVECSGTAVTSTEQFQSMLQSCGGGAVELEVRRDDGSRILSVTPEENEAGIYAIGAWIRDSMAGIGTVTYCDPETGKFGALGHGINDVDTARLMPFSSGSILPSTVKAVKKGQSGSAGQLKGDFALTTELGVLYANTDRGVFGKSDGLVDLGQPIPVATAAEICTGPAVIRCNVEGDTVTEYTVEITKLFDDPDDPRDMLLKVTDERLIAITGGIVQGMSGSPILQNGKLVGAVTHVLVNDPTRGYGIFIENMLEAAE